MIDLFFLGQKYSFPKELKEYVLYTNYFKSIYENLIPLVTNQIKNHGWTGSSDEDFIYFKNPIIKVCNDMISDLSKMKIFDVTVSDLLDSNQGYKNLYEVCKDVNTEMCNILVKSLKATLDSWDNAYDAAASNITGTGVSIWTNSVSAALVHSIMETSAIEKQYNKAVKEYSETIERNGEKIQSEADKDRNDVLINVYYPNVAKSIDLFVSELMQFYLNKLESNNVFFYSKIKQYTNMTRSSELLQNISITDDKEGLLREAFMYCPYNSELYLIISKDMPLDCDIFKTAKFFLQDKILVDPILNKYRELRKIINERKSLALWIKNNISDNGDSLRNINKDELLSRITAAINNNMPSVKLLDELCDSGVIDIKTLYPKSSHTDTIQQINHTYIQLLFDAINEYIDFLLDYAKIKKDELAILKTNLEQATKMKDDINNKIRRLTREQEVTPFYKISEKIRLMREINAAMNEYEVFKSRYNISGMAAEYNQKYKEFNAVYNQLL